RGCAAANSHWGRRNGQKSHDTKWLAGWSERRGYTGGLSNKVQARDERRGPCCFLAGRGRRVQSGRTTSVSPPPLPPVPLNPIDFQEVFEQMALQFLLRIFPSSEAALR